MTMKHQKKKKKRPSPAGKKRPRAIQSPDALAFTIPGFQALGGPGKTSVYELGKRGVLKIFHDPLGRTLIEGESARAFLKAAEG
jgi:hypothetical protein